VAANPDSEPDREHDAEPVTDGGRPVVIRISPIAHLGVGLLTFALLASVFGGPPWAAVALVIPAWCSYLIVRYRTVADRDTVTARSAFGSRTVRWDDIDGLRFIRSKWASAQLKNGEQLRLPAVTFATLPLLTEASGGRVPNPYSR
jgi:hypothetical protein